MLGTKNNFGLWDHNLLIQELLSGMSSMQPAELLNGQNYDTGSGKDDGSDGQKTVPIENEWAVPFLKDDELVTWLFQVWVIECELLSWYQTENSTSNIVNLA